MTALDDAALYALHLLLTTLTVGQGNMDVLDAGANLFNRVASDLGVSMRAHRHRAPGLTPCASRCRSSSLRASASAPSIWRAGPAAAAPTGWSSSRSVVSTAPTPEGSVLVIDATAAKSARCRQPARHFIIIFDLKDAAAGKVTP